MIFLEINMTNNHETDAHKWFKPGNQRSDVSSFFIQEMTIFKIDKVFLYF